MLAAMLQVWFTHQGLLKNGADVNECSNASACGPNTVCNNTDGSYSCACEAGYSVLAGNNTKTDGCAGEEDVRASCIDKV
jgi:hypothetical protein